MPRVKIQGRQVVYHCMSRVAGGEHLLDELGKEKLVHLLRQLTRFCGLELITYCVMSNHFHVLVRVPEAQNPSDSELLARMEVLYGRRAMLVETVRQAMAAQGRIPRDLRASMLRRMGDVSAFMKEVKQRFTRWYNRQTGRRGTLWAERFRSVVVEDQPRAVGTMAAYIDLNPVRAGLVRDPKEYRFCGYAVALVGDTDLRAGLMSFLEAEEWRKAAAEYRRRLYVSAGTAGRSGKAVLARDEIKRVLRQGGELSLGQILRLRLRHFTDGVALGSQDFVNEVFSSYRQNFSERRKTGARPIRGVPLSGLNVLRDLRVRAVS